MRAPSASLLPCSNLPPRPLTTISEATWRAASEDHGNRIFELLSPGFVASAGSRSRRKMSASTDAWRALDGKHPVYNFLVEYYAIKGAKSTRRFARWSPPLMPGGSAVLLEGAGSEEIETGCLLRRGAAIDPGGRGVIYDARAFGHAATSEQCASYLWYAHAHVQVRMHIHMISPRTSHRNSANPTSGIETSTWR